jgi:streptogramin lyase
MKPARIFAGPPLLLALAAIAATAFAQAPPTPVGSTSAVQTATLTFTENATVASINVLTQGAPNLDFQQASGGTCAVGHTYTTGQTCTVNYTFSPAVSGARYGAVALYNNASPAKASATTFLHAVGEGPQAAFPLGTVTTLGAQFTEKGGTDPHGLAIDGAGNLFMADSTFDRIDEIPSEGGYTTVNQIFADPSNGIFGVALDGSGNLFFADGVASTVKELTAASGYTQVNTLATATQYPDGLTVDGSGNVFVCSTSGTVMELVATEGYTTAHTVATGFNNPRDIAVDGNGNLFVTEYASGVQIKEILAAGGYTTVLSIGPSLDFPMGGKVDGNGNVFVDTGAGGGHLWEISAASGYTKTTLLKLAAAQALALDGNSGIFLARATNTPLSRLDLAHPSLNFATTAAGSTSSDSPKTQTALNNGNETLHFSALSYPADFPERAGVASDCTSSTGVTAGGSCTLTAHFSPLRSSATGLSTTLNEDLILTDDNLNVANAEQAVAVSGTETFTPPALITPTPGNPIGSSSATFTWNPGSATTFQFRLGTTPGSNNIYGSGQTNASSETVSNLPTGVNIYAVLYYMLDGAWKSLSYTYPGTPTAPKLTTPAPGSTLSGSTVTFSWNPGTATTFQFRLGTTLGSNNIYGSGQTTKTSETVSNLPTNGETIHAVLYYMVNGAWQYTAYTYTAQ